MANYTIELRNVVETHDIFKFNYPFYNEEKRKEFEDNFIRHFFFREIGTDTIDRFCVLLEDKFMTVFPYYNELFKTSLINYDLVNNYDMTEEYTKQISGNNKQSAVSSTVGSAYDEQNSTSDENRKSDTTGKTKAFDYSTDKGKESTKSDRTGKTVTDTTGNNTSSNTETVEGTTSKNSTTETNSTNEAVKKFLDTPQGLTNLSDTNYVTTVNHDNTTDKVAGTGTESVTDNKNVTSSGEETKAENSTTDNTDNSVSTSETESIKNAESHTGTTATETAEAKTKLSTTGEQRTTSDNNTRVNASNEQNENYKLTRKGNIGVQTASDMLEKHVELQKKLRKIELMFFDECEDLFMLVY